MTTPQEKREELYAHYRTTRVAFEAAIEGLTEAQMIDPSIDGWSVKDHLAHLTIWDELRCREIERISGGGHYAWAPFDDDQLEAFNSSTVPARRAMPFEQVVAEFHASRQRVFDAIAQATEHGLDESNYGEAALKTSHDLKHAEYILNWRARLGI